MCVKSHRPELRKCVDTDVHTDTAKVPIYSNTSIFVCLTDLARPQCVTLSWQVPSVCC